MCINSELQHYALLCRRSLSVCTRWSSEGTSPLSTLMSFPGPCSYWPESQLKLMHLNVPWGYIFSGTTHRVHFGAPVCFLWHNEGRLREVFPNISIRSPPPKHTHAIRLTEGPHVESRYVLLWLGCGELGR